MMSRRNFVARAAFMRSLARENWLPQRPRK